MAVIKVAEFAYPRMEAPDLDEMEEFLTHFGLIRAERTPDALYMRGTDSHHHLHVAQKGGTKFIGFAYHAADQDRTFTNLCDQEIIVNQNGPTRWNTLEVVERTERRFEIRITRCLYHELTTAMGIPELTPVICQIDNAAFNSYLPDEVAFTRGGPGHRISDGAKICNFKWDLIG